MSCPTEAYVIKCLEKVPNVTGISAVTEDNDPNGNLNKAGGYTSPEDAEKRNTYLASFDGSIFASGSHSVIGTVVVRTSNELKASQQKEMEANIIAALIEIVE